MILEIILALIALIGVLGAAWLQSTRSDLRRIRTQVENSHDTNLRDDIDGVRDEFRSGFLAIQTSISLLHQAHTQSLKEMNELRSVDQITQSELSDLRALLRVEKDHT